ncbi:MAG: FixH family protein, partial [Chloroflexi bacterium]|nr:FixH family protein [Chloroflexota bacterium]
SSPDTSMHAVKAGGAVTPSVPPDAALNAAAPAGNADMPGMAMAGASGGAAFHAAPMPVSVTLSPNPPVVGGNTLDLVVRDPAGKPVTGLKLHATVAMTSMDMGTTRPAFREMGNGHYVAAVDFTMAGPWRVDVASMQPGIVNTSLLFLAGSKTKWAASAGALKITGVITNPSVGANHFEVTVLDPAGKPVTGVKVLATVQMVSMDMGTAHPAVREVKPGHYASTVQFTMKGPWRVIISVTRPGGHSEARSFDFIAKG